MATTYPNHCRKVDLTLKQNTAIIQITTLLTTPLSTSVTPLVNRSENEIAIFNANAVQQFRANMTATGHRKAQTDATVHHLGPREETSRRARNGMHCGVYA